MDTSRTRSPAGIQGGELGMSEAELNRFLSEPRVAAFSWRTPKGEIHSTPMWFTHREQRFLLHTGHPSPKTRALLANDRVALVIHDDAPPYRYVSIRGRARVRHGPEEALRLYREQAYAYYGRLSGRLYLRRVLPTFAGSEHVILEVEPEKLVALDARTALDPFSLLGLRVVRAIGL